MAEHLEERLRAMGREVEILDVNLLPEGFSPDRYAGAVLAASVHIGKHEREMVDFVRRHREALERIPTAFLSVSLSEAGAEDPDAPEERRRQAREDVERMVAQFFERTGWRADLVQPVAGALLYRKYGFFLRFVMKRIAKSAGGSTDTSRDHEYTDWAALDRFAEAFAAREMVAG